MRKVIMFNRISVDGFFAGLDNDIDWFIHDPAVDIEAHKLMNPDTMLIGRKTYQMFESFWPGIASDESASEHLRNISKELNEMIKVVFSGSLNQVTWENSILIKVNIFEEVRKIKQSGGSDIVIFGSGSLVRQLSAEGLIDEYIFVISPIALGKGKSFFPETGIKLELLNSISFKSGHTLIHYKIR